MKPPYPTPHLPLRMKEVETNSPGLTRLTNLTNLMDKFLTQDQQLHAS